MRRFWLGVLAALVTGAVGVLAFLGLGLMPVSADAKPGAFESWLAGFARDAAIERAAPERQSPLRSGSGWVDATREWLVGAKGEYPIHRPYLPGNEQIDEPLPALAHVLREPFRFPQFSLHG